MLYFGRVKVPDAFVAFGLGRKKYAVVSALEFGRVKKTSAFDVVLPLEKYLQRARELWPQRKPGPAEVIYLLAKDYRQSRFTVPDDFPCGLYEKLYALGLNVAVADGPLFPARELKTPVEAASIRRATDAPHSGSPQPKKFSAPVGSAGENSFTAARS